MLKAASSRHSEEVDAVKKPAPRASSCPPYEAATMHARIAEQSEQQNTKMQQKNKNKTAQTCKKNAAARTRTSVSSGLRKKCPPQTSVLTPRRLWPNKGAVQPLTEGEICYSMEKKTVPQRGLEPRFPVVRGVVNSTN